MPPPVKKDLKKRIDAYRRCGYNVSAAARELGIHRTMMQSAIKAALESGMLSDEEVNDANPPKTEQFSSARANLIRANQRKREKADWTKASDRYIGPGKFILGIFGDKHADNPGCDYEALETDWCRLDPENRVFGLFMGDEFDNWPRAMGHLWKENPTDPEDAWVFYDYLMREHPPLALVTGNHDQFSSAPVDPLMMLCDEVQTIYRRSGMHLRLTGGTNPIVVAARHIWKGNSQYSTAHNLKRAATFGHVDADIIAGAHIHKGELRTHVRPHDGRIMHLAQMSSYKSYDNYANDRGFMSEKTPPCVWCVCDPERDVNDHGRVTMFYDFDAAVSLRDAT